MQIGGTLATLATKHFTVELVAPAVTITRRGFHAYMDTTIKLAKVAGGVACTCDIMLFGFGVFVIYPIKLIK